MFINLLSPNSFYTFELRIYKFFIVATSNVGKKFFLNFFSTFAPSSKKRLNEKGKQNVPF